jgi:transketolase
MEVLSDDKIRELREKATEIRLSIIEMLIEAGSGHSAGPLGMADIFTALYFHIMRHDSKNPKWEERDRLILSNGHIAPVLYATMAHAGYLPVEELKTLRKFGSKLQGHPHREFLPALENSSGPLGSGLSQAVGMALADKIDRGPASARQFYCLLSDGEHGEGNMWEAVMLAGKYKIQNLTAIIDRNNIQIDGYTENILPLEPLADKWRAFNWHVQEIDGHNFEEIVAAVGQAHAVYEKPSVIIAHTIPGKGVSYMENHYEWHGAPPGAGPEDIVPKAKQGEEAIKQLRTLHGKIESEHEPC